MTILTYDYDSTTQTHYCTADGKEVDYSTFCDLRVKNAIEQTLIIAPLKVIRKKDGGLCTPTKAYDYEAFLSYEKFLFRVSTTKERLKIKLSQSHSLKKPQSPVLSFMDYLN